jgi:hypothetical protein
MLIVDPDSPEAEMIPATRRFLQVDENDEPVPPPSGGGTLTTRFNPPQDYNQFIYRFPSGTSPGTPGSLIDSVPVPSITVPDLLADFPADREAGVTVRVEVQQLGGVPGGFDAGQALRYFLLQLWNEDEDGEDHLRIGVEWGFAFLPVGETGASPNEVRVGQMWLPLRNAGSNPNFILRADATLKVAPTGDLEVKISIPLRAPYSTVVE